MKTFFTFLSVFFISILMYGQTTVTIYDIQYTTNVTGDSPYNSQTITTTGTVTAIATGKYWIQSGGGAWNGIYVYDASHTPAIGDNITITGLVTEYYNLTEIKTITSYVTNSTGNSVVVTNVSTADAATEAYEGVLVKLQNAQCTVLPNTYNEWNVNDGSGVATVDDMIYSYSPIVLNEYYDITGVIDYSFSLFKVEPRSAADVSVSVTEPPVGSSDTITFLHYNLLGYIDTYVNCDQTNNNIDTKEAGLKLIVKELMPDILTFNEFGDNSSYVTRMLTNVLNTDGITYYQSSPYAAEANTSIINMVFYNSNKLQYISESLITHSVSGMRKTKVEKYKYKNSTENIYLYCILTHLKAGSTSADSLDRATMTSEVMSWMQSNINTPGNYVVMGDMNLYSSNELAYQNMTNTGITNIKMNDPINTPGDWGIYPNSAYKSVHTQSTHDEVYPGDGCHATGGLDDRFDFILISDAIKNATQKMSYLSNSYKAYGQDGNHYNLSIIDGTNSVVSSEIATALFNVSDHLPVTMKLGVDLATSINSSNNQNNIELTVFPNPAKNSVTLRYESFASNGKIHIFNALGDNIATINLTQNSGEELLNIENYSNGIYLFTFETPDGFKSSKRFVVLR